MNVLKFKDETGMTQYGVSVTVREEIIDTKIIQRYRVLRRECRAAKVITKFMKTSQRKRISSRKRCSLKRSSFNNIFDRVGSDTGFKSMQKVINDKSSERANAAKAKESFETMIENSKLGETCVVEKCFIFTGTHEQSLMLCGLKQITDLERKVSHQS